MLSAFIYFNALFERRKLHPLMDITICDHEIQKLDVRTLSILYYFTLIFDYILNIEIGK